MLEFLLLTLVLSQPQPDTLNLNAISIDSLCTVHDSCTAWQSKPVDGTFLIEEGLFVTDSIQVLPSRVFVYGHVLLETAEYTTEYTTIREYNFNP